jgi:peroxiredoxin
MKNLIWTIVVSCVLFACKEHQGYVITGEVSGVEDGTPVVLKKLVDTSEPVSLDSTVVKKGKFQMKGTVEYPEYGILYIGNNGPLVFFVENVPIQVHVNMSDMSASTVTGSKETDLMAEFSKRLKNIDDRIVKVNDDYMALKLSGENDTDRETKYIEQMDQLQQERIDCMKDFVRENPNSIFSALLIDRNLSYYISPDQMELYLNGFDETNAKSPWVRSIGEKVKIAMRLAEGQPFIDVSLPSPDGNRISLSDYAGKGKYVLVDFWASWCRPCRLANPHVVKLYRDYRDKGFEIVGISLDRDKKEWTQAIDDDKLTWPQMSDLQFWQSEAAKLYSITSIPYTILLDKEGKILAKNLRGEELDAKLDELFNK